jgi:hypothetical protein
MVVLRWVFRIVAAVVVLIALVFIGARFHDGPLGPIPGGPLVGGDAVSVPITDWTFAADVPEIELQLVSQRKSRTTWLLVHEGKAYVPASTEYPPGKTWHRAALEDGRAIVRILGKRYAVTLTKVDDPTLTSTIREQVAAEKYPMRPGGDAWLFAMTPRAAGS